MIEWHRENPANSTGAPMLVSLTLAKEDETRDVATARAPFGGTRGRSFFGDGPVGQPARVAGVLPFERVALLAGTFIVNAFLEAILSATNVPDGLHKVGFHRHVLETKAVEVLVSPGVVAASRRTPRARTPGNENIWRGCSL